MHQPLKTILELRIRNSIRYPLASIEDIKNYIKKYGDRIKCPECFKAKVERVPALEHDVENETERIYLPGAVWYVDDKGPYDKAIGGERYILFFVERESRMPLAYFRKDKNQWVKDLNSFFNDCQLMLGKCI